jgi:hypothetical protein
LLLLYNRIWKKPNHVALLLVLLVLLLSHTRWKPPKNKIPWGLQKLPHRHLGHFPCNNNTKHSPIHNNTFPLNPNNPNLSFTVCVYYGFNMIN